MTQWLVLLSTPDLLSTSDFILCSSFCGSSIKNPFTSWSPHIERYVKPGAMFSHTLQAHIKKGPGGVLVICCPLSQPPTNWVTCKEAQQTRTKTTGYEEQDWQVWDLVTTEMRVRVCTHTNVYMCVLCVECRVKHPSTGGGNPHCSVHKASCWLQSIIFLHRNMDKAHNDIYLPAAPGAPGAQ